MRLGASYTDCQDIGYGSIENAKTKAAAFEKVLYFVAKFMSVQERRHD
jgi:hypothetical protein